MTPWRSWTSTNFATGNPALLPLLAEGGNCVVGVDWRSRLDVAWDAIGHDRAIQGNLDPVILFGSVDLVKKEVKRILERVGGRPGHIFNLGHGILPNTPVENVAALIDVVDEFSAKRK